MMGEIKIDEKDQIEREVKLWCRIRKYPYTSYEILSTSDKNTFHNLICQPLKITSDKQRRDLFRHMFLPGNFVAGRDSVDPLDSIPTKKQDDTLSPLTPEEKYNYLSKF